MVIALSMKNKLGFIDGSIPRPDGNDSLLNSWIRNINMVISWILNSISKEISASVIYSDFAYEMWLALKEHFQQKNGPHIFQLRCDLMNHTQGSSSVSAYFTKLKKIWEELSNYRPFCSCGKCVCGGTKALADHSQKEYVMSFLMGLHDSFAQVRGQLLLMDPIPPINKVFSLVSQEAHQRNVNVTSVGSGGVESMAFAVKNDVARSNNGQNFPRGQRKDNLNSNKPVYTHWGYVGHTIDKCYKLHGYPLVYKPKFNSNTSHQASSNQTPAVANQVSNSVNDLSRGNAENSRNFGSFVQMLNPSQDQHLMTMLNTHLSAAKIGTEADAISAQASGTCFSVAINPIFNSSKHWNIDSGATSHICFNQSAFHTMKPLKNSFVTLPNHNRIPFHFSGTVKLNSFLLLQDVHYIPHFRFNLIS
ncbi:uncharacterized protein LOC116128896 [Pistacia vera]|uniref:uncharacterized protein LOC116128896 n=1 Tax=Pistacia vera TaxID=55513 RepID=UPI001262E175|nr:uncharacterized protein LOC116128896 [Pistacia vera]